MIPLYLTFTCKHDLHRKAGPDAYGHVTDSPPEASYSGVMSIESMHLAMFVAIHNRLNTLACDIVNTYFEATTKEKIYIITGNEFGFCGHAGKTLVIRKTLYSIRTSGACFHERLSETLHAMGYHSSKADPDLWMKDMGDH